MKRQKEAARKRKQMEKTQKRVERAAEREERPTVEGEDPDIAGIVPGPQPLPEEYGIVDDFRARPGAAGDAAAPADDEEEPTG